MGELAAAGCVFAVGLGVFLILVSRHPVSESRASRQSGRVGAWVRRRRITMIAGITGGFGIYLLTGIAVTVIAVPVLTVVVTWLLEDPPNREIELLESLDRWVRTLGTSIAAGRSVTDAIRHSRRCAPALLHEPLSLVVRRLDERWSIREALQAMARELGSPAVDTVLAALMLAAERGGTGVATTLFALADSTQDQLRAWRDIEAERAKPRVVVRQITLLSVVVLGLGFVVGRGYFAPYRTALGQLLLASLLACYLGSLVVLRRMTTPRARARILSGAPR